MGRDEEIDSVFHLAANVYVPFSRERFESVELESRPRLEIVGESREEDRIGELEKLKISECSDR